MENEEKLIPFHPTNLTGKRVLVLAPHPDDETIGCGGSLAIHANAGDLVKVVFLTNGAKGDTSGKAEKKSYIKIRQEEAMKACRCLGITDLEFWAYEDRALAGSRGVLTKVIDLLEKYKPELVYCPSLLEIHPDHRATAVLLYEAIRTRDMKFEIAFYEVGQPLSVNCLVDITGVLNQKVLAGNAYSSQLRERPYKDVFLGLNRFRSLTLSDEVTHAEGFSLWETDIIRKMGLYAIPFQNLHRLEPAQGEAGPLVSVIVRTKDRPSLLANALKSIAQQTYANLEIIVVNDGGQDVRAVVNALAGDIPVVYIHHEKSKGRSAAANSGLKAAHGAYFNFLDDDDVFYPGHVETLVSYLLSKEAKVAYSSVLNVYFNSPPNMPENRAKEELMFNFDFDSDRLLFENYIPLMSILFSRDVLSRGESFCDNMVLFEDWDFLVKISRRFTFHHIDKVTAEYRFYGMTNMEKSHRQKYRYDEARAMIFDRVLPFLTGNAWVNFLNGGSLERLKRDSRNWEAKLSELEQALRNYQAMAQEQEQQIHAKDAAIQEQEQQIHAKDAAIQEQEQQIHQFRSQIDSLQMQVENERLFRDVTLNSRSWKVTAPLRWMSIYVRKSKRKVRTIRYFFNRRYRLIKKSGLFDASYYLRQNSDVAESGMNPLVHYLEFGAGEGRNPNSLSDASYYDDEFVAENNETYPSDNSRIRTIAFYLPQFHPIPENDKWWGKGFTEWTNVTKATPQFVGHYQPHLPGELGFYDLRLVDVQKRQIELAKKYGIYGFCFHYYWFSGKRLLERPINQFLADKELDFPFCFCWANENWTRRWDGLENEILIAQSHKKKDVIAFIKDLEFALKDSRYIKVDGKPLLIVYLASNLPNPVETVKCWRNYCVEAGIGDLYLVAAQTFGIIDPRPYGFDAAIEFPPHNEIDEAINDEKVFLNAGFKGKIYDYKNLVQRKSYTVKPEFEHYPTVFPSWDNEARKPGKGQMFCGSSPDLYQKWFKSACNYADANNNPDKKLVFINAWNEWAEGAHLEPDRKYGYAYLQATADVLRQYPSLNALKRVSNKSGNRRFLLVAHDAHPMGSQYLILHMAKALVEDFGFAVDMVVLGDGPLLEDYERYATLHMLSGKDARGEKAKTLAAELFTEGVRSAIANTAVTGLFAQVLKEQGFHVISLIHELPITIKYYNLQPHLKSIAEYADSIVFPAKKVLEGFERFSQVSSQQAVICPQGLYRKNLIRNKDQIEKARKDLRSQLGLPENAQIVLCVGHGDHRKGIDLFVDIGMIVIGQMPNTYFLWVGRVEPDIMKAVESSGFPQHYIFTGHKSQVDIYYAGSDVFALTSREDPFPSVIMEALDVKIPVVAFDEAGGFTDLLSRGGGQLVPAFETDAFARAVTDLLSQPENAHALGVSGYEIVEREFSFRRYVFDLLKLAKTPIKRVSVIIPNYNYAEYLAERIKTIVDQEYLIYEIIILDDASSDDSVPVINKIISTLNIDCRLIINESNSGNPFAQWLKGVELARGDYIWIAEADDLSEPGFLDEVLQQFKDPSVAMSYCQSKQMDSECKILCDDYLDYVSDVSSDKWSECYVENGLDEIRTCLAIKNTIPNVSAVVFERNALLHVLKEKIKEIKEYFVAGDWLTYIFILNKGKIAFSPKAYNLHRRHQHSVTIGNFNLSQLEEILGVQQKVRNNFRPDEEVITKAKAYSQRLYKDFNLVTCDAPILAKHPRLAAYLDD